MTGWISNISLSQIQDQRQTRNYGAERSEGEYLIMLDSDVILPEEYFDAIEAELLASPADASGGPDRAHDSFTDIQKAISIPWLLFHNGEVFVAEKENG